MKTKVGLITTMSKDSTWPEAVVRKVINDHKRAKIALESLGFEVIIASDSISRTKEDMEKHGRILVEK